MKQADGKILYVITDLLVGGVPLHLYGLARVMRGRGFEPIVVSLAPAGPVAGLLREEEIEVHDCAGRGGWDFRVIRRLARLITNVQPHILHAFLFHANVAARRAARKARLPREQVICEIQTVEVERRWHLVVDRWTHGGCRFTIGNSPSVVEHLATRGRIPRDRLRLVRGGVDPSRFRGVAPLDRSELGLKDDNPIVLWVGRLDPVKGLLLLLDAFAPLGPETGAHLLLAGTGPMHDELERVIARRGLADNVSLLGSRDDVPALLQTADLFVFPSRTEGLPNALLEAMAACRPVITTDVPGCRDLVENENTGLVVPYGDTKALTRAMRQLLHDHDLAVRLGRRAGEEIEHHWHIKQTYDTYEAIYREIAAVSDP